MRRISLNSFALIAVGLVVAAAGFAGGIVVGRWPTRSSGALNAAELNRVYNLLKDNFDGQLDTGKVNDGAKAGLVAGAGDPYTVYLTPDALKALNDQLSGTLSGIGAEVGIKNAKLVVISPIADTPAAKAGLRAGDQIIKIDGQDPSGLSLDEAVAKIRGQAGSKVKLTLVRGSQNPFDVTITRAVINVPSVKWSMKPNNIGYINITEFGTDTARLMDQAARELKAQGAQKIVLDLRNDPGGYLDAAVKVAGHFLNNQLVVSEKHNGVTKDQQSTGSGADLAGLPTVVLINGGSASASEILAGALQDHHAATLLGEKSFGKGSVQEIHPLPDGAALKVTIAHWYTPGGKNITKEGITPDTEVKMTAADYDASRDPQLDAALAELAK